MCCKELKEIFGESRSHCITTSSVAKENNREFRIKSQSGSVICKIKIDDCLIDDMNKLKCDYLFKVCNINKFVLVELKGTDIIHAVNQIIATLDYLKQFLNFANVEAFIISSAVPSAAEQRFRNLKESIYRKRGLKISKIHFKHTLPVE